MKPPDWDEVKLQDGVTLISGQHILSNQCTDNPKHTPYLTGPADFSKGRIMTSKFARSPKVTCQEGDILITVKGSGTGTIIRADKSYCISRQLMAIRTNKWDSEFLFFALLLKGEQYNDNAVGLIPGVTREDILTTRILLPPFDEQKSIARILNLWVVAIERLQALIAAKTKLKRGLMQQLLTGKKRFKEFEGQEWIKVGAGEIFKNVSVKGKKNEELLSATQDKGIIPRSMLEARVTMPTGDTNSFKLVEVGDFVISLRSFQGGLEYSYYRGIVSPAYTVLKPKKKINAEYYKQYYKSYEFIGHLATAVIGIRDGKQISYEDFCFVKIPFPSIEEQKRIAAVLNACDKEIKLLQKQLAALKEQKRGLMQKLLTGQIRVKVDGQSKLEGAAV